jgi:hypothetical protein
MPIELLSYDCSIAISFTKLKPFLLQQKKIRENYVVAKLINIIYYRAPMTCCLVLCIRRGDEQ